MRLGIGSYAFAWALGVPGHLPATPLGAAGLIEATARLGLGVAQLADNVALRSLEAGELLALKRHAADAGVAIELGARGLTTENLEAYLGIAEIMGASMLRAVIDAEGYEPQPLRITELLSRFIPRFESQGIILAIENHDRFPAAELAAIARSVRSDHVGVCLDTVNSFGALEGPVYVVETLGPLCVNLHVKDFVVRRADHKMGFAIDGVPAGEGRLDLSWLFERLASMGRDPNAILELWVPPEPELDATIAKEWDWALRSVAHLRKLVPA